MSFNRSTLKPAMIALAIIGLSIVGVLCCFVLGFVVGSFIDRLTGGY